MEKNYFNTQKAKLIAKAKAKNEGYKFNPLTADDFITNHLDDKGNRLNTYNGYLLSLRPFITMGHHWKHGSKMLFNENNTMVNRTPEIDDLKAKLKIVLEQLGFDDVDKNNIAQGFNFKALDYSKLGDTLTADAKADKRALNKEKKNVLSLESLSDDEKAEKIDKINSKIDDVINGANYTDDNTNFARERAFAKDFERVLAFKIAGLALVKDNISVDDILSTNKANRVITNARKRNIAETTIKLYTSIGDIAGLQAYIKQYDARVEEALAFQNPEKAAERFKFVLSLNSYTSKAEFDTLLTEFCKQYCIIEEVAQILSTMYTEQETQETAEQAEKPAPKAKKSKGVKAEK